MVCLWMGDCSGMSISVDSPSDETLNRGPLALLLWRQYEFPFGIDIVAIFNNCNTRKLSKDVFASLKPNKKNQFRSSVKAGSAIRPAIKKILSKNGKILIELVNQHSVS